MRQAKPPLPYRISLVLFRRHKRVTSRRDEEEEERRKKWCEIQRYEVDEVDEEQAEGEFRSREA